MTVGKDKLQHAAAGALVGGVAAGTIAVVTGDPVVGALLGVVLGAGVGFVKEIRDSKRGGTTSLGDYAATAIGSFAGVGIWLLLRVVGS